MTSPRPKFRAPPTDLTTLTEIKDAILAGADVSSFDPGTGIGPIHSLLRVNGGSFRQFDEVLRLFLARGVNIGSALDFAHGDNLRAALIKNGVSVKEGRPLLVRSVLGEQHETVKAILERGVVPIKGLNRAFSALCEVYRLRDYFEFPYLYKLVHAGAQINSDRILDDVADTNPHLVLTLIGLGAYVNGGWHSRRRVLNSPLHGICHMSREVFDILIRHGADVNWRGEKGFTPVMELMHGVAGQGGELSEACHAERFRWLVGEGASCLLRDDRGNLVSDTVRGKTPAFRELISRAIGNENWGRRRVVILLRVALCFHEERGDVVLGAATIPCVGVFRKIVSFL